MAEILHRIEINDDPRRVYEAIAEVDGLRSWWTPMTTSSADHSSIAFRFGDGNHGPDMAVSALEPGRRVAWECVEGPWVGHDFEFDIQPRDEGGSVLLFAHRGWEEPDEFYMHCNSKWGFFLLSLKSYVETGVGAPHPQDPDL